MAFQLVEFCVERLLPWAKPLGLFVDHGESSSIHVQHHYPGIRRSAPTTSSKQRVSRIVNLKPSGVCEWHDWVARWAGSRRTPLRHSTILYSIAESGTFGGKRMVIWRSWETASFNARRTTDAAYYTLDVADVRMEALPGKRAASSACSARANTPTRWSLLDERDRPRLRAGGTEIVGWSVSSVLIAGRVPGASSCRKCGNVHFQWHMTVQQALIETSTWLPRQRERQFDHEASGTVGSRRRRLGNSGASLSPLEALAPHSEPARAICRARSRCASSRRTGRRCEIAHQRRTRAVTLVSSVDVRRDRTNHELICGRPTLETSHRKDAA